jgi:hypothetical protein
MRAFAIVILVVGFMLGCGAAAFAETDAPAERPAKITADRLNLRDAPSTSGAVVGSMVQGDEVTILEEQGEWYNVRLADGQTGWAAAKFIQVIAGEPAETPKASKRESSSGGAKAAMTGKEERHQGGGGSVIGSVIKWGCLLGAGVCGYLSYSESTKGDDSYDDYKARYAELTPPQGTWSPQAALEDAEHFRLDAEDHDSSSKTFAIAAGGLGAAFLVQQLFLGKDGDQAANGPTEPAEAPLLACGLRQGQLRAAVTLARF